MNYRERIISDYQVMLGKPVIKGTRITVELVLRKLSEGATTQDLVRMYPHLQEEDITAALRLRKSGFDELINNLLEYRLYKRLF